MKTILSFLLLSCIGVIAQTPIGVREGPISIATSGGTSTGAVQTVVQNFVANTFLISSNVTTLTPGFVYSSRNLDNQPIITVESKYQEHRDPGVILIGNTVYCYYTGVSNINDVIQIGMAFSTNYGTNWTRVGTVFTNNPTAAQFDSTAVLVPRFYYENGTNYMIYLGLPGSSIGIAYSTDNTNWTRVSNTAIISPSETWELTTSPCTFTKVGDTYVILYYGGGNTGASYRAHHGGTIGIATATTITGPYTKQSTVPISDAPTLPYWYLNEPGNFTLANNGIWYGFTDAGRINYGGPNTIAYMWTTNIITGPIYYNDFMLDGPSGDVDTGGAEDPANCLLPDGRILMVYPTQKGYGSQFNKTAKLCVAWLTPGYVSADRGSQFYIEDLENGIGPGQWFRALAIGGNSESTNSLSSFDVTATLYFDHDDNKVPGEIRFKVVKNGTTGIWIERVFNTDLFGTFDIIRGGTDTNGLFCVDLRFKNGVSGNFFESFFGTVKIENDSSLPSNAGGSPTVIMDDVANIVITNFFTTNFVLQSSSRNYPSSPTYTPARSNIRAQAAGAVYTLTATSALLDFGQTDPVVTIPEDGFYLLLANIGIQYAAVTFASATNLEFQIFNNTTGQLVSGTQRTNLTPVGNITTLNIGDGIYPIPPIVTQFTNGTVLQLRGRVAALPAAGSVNAVSAEIQAIKLY